MIDLEHTLGVGYLGLMKRAIVIALYLVCIESGFAFAQADTNQLQQSIVNGGRSPRSVGLQESEVLAIGALTNFEDPTSAFCTGTVITDRVVVTAAHCIVSSNGRTRTADDLSFVIGENPEVDGRLFDVSQIVVHPDYIANSDNSQATDVALLLLAQNISSQAPELLPIAFNRHPLTGLDADALSNRTVEIAGYGVTQTNESGRFFTSVELIEINELTVLIDGKGQTGACEGDSGGPLITLNTRQVPVIIGVLRGGSTNCVGQDHYVRLDVPVVQTWIEAQIMRTWPTYPEGSVCGSLSFYGRCVSDHVEYCGADFRVIRQDCLSASVPSTCSFVSLDDGYACRPLVTCTTASCSSRYDGFLPPAPLSIVNEGGCATTAIPIRRQVTLLLILLCVLRRRRC